MVVRKLDGAFTGVVFGSEAGVGEGDELCMGSSEVLVSAGRFSLRLDRTVLRVWIFCRWLLGDGVRYRSWVG